MTTAKHKSDIELTKDTPHLALTGELRGVSCKDWEEKLRLYNGTALHMVIFLQNIPTYNRQCTAHLQSCHLISNISYTADPSLWTHNLQIYNLINCFRLWLTLNLMQNHYVNQWNLPSIRLHRKVFNKIFLFKKIIMKFSYAGSPPSCHKDRWVKHAMFNIMCCLCEKTNPSVTQSNQQVDNLPTSLTVFDCRLICMLHRKYQDYMSTYKGSTRVLCKNKALFETWK